MAEPPEKKRRIDWGATFRLPRLGDRVCTQCGFTWYNEVLRDDVFVCCECRWVTNTLCEQLSFWIMLPFEWRGNTVDLTVLEQLNRHLREIIAEYLESPKIGCLSKLVYVDEG